MSEALIISHAANALMLVLVLSLPPIAAASIIGLLVSLVQALTQIQEQTISFAVKLVAIIVVLFAGAGWIGSELITYAHASFEMIGKL